MRRISIDLLIGPIAAGSLRSVASVAAIDPPGLLLAVTATQAEWAAPNFQLVQYRPNHRPDRWQCRARSNRDALRHRSCWDRRRGNGYYDRTYGGERRDNGSAVADGFLGFVLGAAIESSASGGNQTTSRQNDRIRTASCARRYQFLDAHSGTYLGNGGYRHHCHSTRLAPETLLSVNFGWRKLMGIVGSRVHPSEPVGKEVRPAVSNARPPTLSALSVAVIVIAVKAYGATAIDPRALARGAHADAGEKSGTKPRNGERGDE